MISLLGWVRAKFGATVVLVISIFWAGYIFIWFVTCSMVEWVKKILGMKPFVWIRRRNG